MSSEIIKSLLVIGTTLVALVVLFHPRVVSSTSWRATVTPLASIIGSGFLVLGPILKHSFGVWGIAVMLALCLAAYLFGNAIRFNIARYDEIERLNRETSLLVSRLETVAGISLVLAYVISITYYLNLFGAFAVSLTSVDNQVHARIVTSAVLTFIMLFGWMRGFRDLERIEEGTVGLKLSIIVGLLVGLLALFWEQVREANIDISSPDEFTWHSVFIALGLVITVQGFETSRYLGSEFDATTRIRTMKISQWVSSAVYMGYIALTTICFTDAQVPDSETGIIGMTTLVAPVLPVMLVAAALAAQFSAAVADTGGCGGLAEEVSHKRIKAKTSYLLIGVVGIGMTWAADIYSIISYASRAFAVYYALQCMIAFVFAVRSDSRNRGKAIVFGLLTLLAVGVVVLGRPAE